MKVIDQDLLVSCKLPYFNFHLCLLWAKSQLKLNCPYCVSWSLKVADSFQKEQHQHYCFVFHRKSKKKILLFFLPWGWDLSALYSEILSSNRVQFCIAVIPIKMCKAFFMVSCQTHLVKIIHVFLHQIIQTLTPWSITFTKQICSFRNQESKSR